MLDDMADALKIAASIACLAALFIFGDGAAAGNVDDLYQARTIVTGQGEVSRRVGFADCLEQVLVKVSGDSRLLDDPEITAMADEAGTFVADFHYRDRMAGIPVHDEQGTRDRPYDLTVSFDPTRIDTALRSLGHEPGARHGRAWSCSSLYASARRSTSSPATASAGVTSVKRSRTPPRGSGYRWRCLTRPHWPRQA
jgi:hypothetical protein